MKTKAHNQSKFMRVVAIPVRLVCKARDVYVKSIIDCSTRMGYGHSMALPTGRYPPLPWSFSIGSSRCNDNEDYRKLVRAASARSLGQRNEIEMLIQQLRQQQSSIMVGSKMFLPKSCGFGMGIMGRIDGDKPCDFETGAGAVVKPQLGPRSRSFAVGRKG
jgi:hypothetical protein